MIFTALPLAAFEFLSLPMLGWLAAAILPWLIHRWNWRQHRTVAWAAVDLLRSAIQQRARPVQLQQWLLIAVRTAILILVALAAAEPVLRQWALGAGQVGRSHLVLVVDQSYSMSVRQEDASRFERAKALARRLVASRPSGDAFSVLGWSRTTKHVLGRPTRDASLALSAIDSLAQADSSADLTSAIRAARAALDRAESKVPQLDHHQVVFFSDRARNLWKASQAEQLLIEELAKRARLTLIDVGDPQRNNLAIVDLSVEPTIIPRQHEVSISATLQGFGNPTWEGIDVELRIDGHLVETEQIYLSAENEATVHFFYSFDEVGTHTVQVSVADALDCLPIDNQRWLVVQVRPPLRVACVAGKPGAADDLARALAPGKLQTIRPEILPISQLGELDLSHYDAVLLCNVAEINRREAAQVTQFVQMGGGLALWLGEKTSAERLNYPLLPVKIDAPVPVGEYRFDTLEYAHPVVAAFRGRENAGLRSVAIMRYCRLKIKPERRSAERVLALDTGDPALVVDRFGLGRVAVVAIPGSLATRTDKKIPWSSFAVSPSFLPSVRELVAYLVGDRWLEERNLLVGQSALCSWDGSRPETEVVVRRPDGGKQILRTPAAEEQNQLRLAETTTSGIYQLRAAGALFARFAVNLDTRESDLSTLDQLPAGITTEPAARVNAGRLAGTNHRFASDLLAGAAMLLLAELGLAFWLGRRWR